MYRPHIIQHEENLLNLWKTKHVIKMHIIWATQKHPSFDAPLTCVKDNIKTVSKTFSFTWHMVQAIFSICDLVRLQIIAFFIMSIR